MATNGMINPGAAMEVVPPYDTWQPQRSLALNFSMTGPTSGLNLIASTAFTVSLPTNQAVAQDVKVTPADSGTGNAGVFTPASVLLSDAVRTATFTYTPGSTGVKVISVTDNRNLSDPANISYTSS